MTKTIRILCCFCLMGPFIAYVGDDMEQAWAQEKRSLFGRLFGRPKPPTVATPPQIDKRRSSPRQHQARRTRSPSPNRAPATPRVEKSDHAKRVLVIGDFVASAMAEGLTQSYRDNPDLVVIKHVEVASGLVRDDYYNWVVKAAEFIEAEKPDMIFVSMGGNDRQAFRIEKNMLAYGEEEWEQRYRTRLERLTERLQKSGKPWVWIGLPPFKKTVLNQSAAAFNSLYKDSTEKSGAIFIDIWDGFVDGEGNFSFSGYDVNGQTARLRNNDGINFTTAGYRKLAFYADRTIRTLLEDAEPPLTVEDVLTQTDPSPAPSPDVSLPETHRVSATGLWDLGGEATSLTGGRSVKNHDSSHTSPRLTRTFQPQAGRADYFSLTDP